MTREENGLYHILGLCRKAGRIVTGTDAVVDSVRTHQAGLVLVACNASANTRKRLKDSCSFYDVRIEEIPLSMEEISHATGKHGNISAAAITDSGFIRATEGFIGQKSSDRADA